MGEASCKTSKQDFVEACQAIYRAWLASWIGILWFVTCSAVLTVVLTLAMKGMNPLMHWQYAAQGVSLWVLTMMIGFMVVNHHVIVPRNAERMFGKRPADDAGSTLRWTEEQISLRGHKGETIAPWTDFKLYLETPRALILVAGPSGTSLVLPKAEIGADGLATILGHLASHGARRASFWNA